MNYAPIAIFVYNRPQHTSRMIDSLLRNSGLNESPVTVFSDAARTPEQESAVAQTRKIIRDKLPGAEVIEQPVNCGIANSVIRGVSELCQRYGRVIVIEDDLVLSPVFLKYMNNSLDHYEGFEDVMHISAYSPPVTAALPSTFFFREPSPWGWATWQRAWQHFEPDADKLAKKLYEHKQIKAFNLDHAFLFWEMLLRQLQNEIDSWAIRWYASMFLRRGLSLYPAASLVQNHGFDGSGQHCDATTDYEVSISSALPALLDEIRENEVFVKAMKRYRTRNQLHHLSNIIKNVRARRTYRAALQED